MHVFLVFFSMLMGLFKLFCSYLILVCSAVITNLCSDKSKVFSDENVNFAVIKFAVTNC
jgi:hypothetical protein